MSIPSKRTENVSFLKLVDFFLLPQTFMIDRFAFEWEKGTLYNMENTGKEVNPYITLEMPLLH